MHARLNSTATWLIMVAFGFALLIVGSAWSQSSTNPREAKTASSATKAGPLDGQQFRAGIVRDGADADEKNRPLEDLLIFSDGKFSSVVCKRYNFTGAPYWMRLEGGQVHFFAELTSPTDGTMIWKGTVRGDVLEGTMRWTKKRWYWTIDTEHKIRGKLEKALNATSNPAE